MLRRLFSCVGKIGVSFAGLRHFFALARPGPCRRSEIVTVARGARLEIALADRNLLRVGGDSALRVAMTRDGDFFVPLRTRVAKARAVQADLFVSIHADAWIRPDVRGSSVFALSEHGASSSAAAWMAKRENDADLIGGINLASADRNLARVLLDLSTTAQINDSLKLGNAVLRELERVNRLHKPNVEQAGFAVLKAPDIPSILVETAFISNPDEELMLRSERQQQRFGSGERQAHRAEHQGLAIAGQRQTHAVHVRRAPDVFAAAQDRVLLHSWGDQPTRALKAVLAVVIDPRFAEDLTSEPAVPAFFLAGPGVACIGLARLEVEGVRGRAQPDDRPARRKNADQGTGVGAGMVPAVGLVAMMLGIAAGREAGQLLSFMGTCIQLEPLVQSFKIIAAPVSPKQSTTCWPFNASIVL